MDTQDKVFAEAKHLWLLGRYEMAALIDAWEDELGCRKKASIKALYSFKEFVKYMAWQGYRVGKLGTDWV